MYHDTTIFNRAVVHAMNNKETISQSCLVGCFYCLRTFAAHALNLETHTITHFSKDGIEKTVYCPMCGVDAMIGDASGFEVTAEFLSYMHYCGYQMSDDEEHKK